MTLATNDPERAGAFMGRLRNLRVGVPDGVPVRAARGAIRSAAWHFTRLASPAGR